MQWRIVKHLSNRHGLTGSGSNPADTHHQRHTRLLNQQYDNGNANHDVRNDNHNLDDNNVNHVFDVNVWFIFFVD